MSYHHIINYFHSLSPFPFLLPILSKTVSQPVSPLINPDRESTRSLGTRSLLHLLHLLRLLHLLLHHLHILGHFIPRILFFFNKSSYSFHYITSSTSFYSHY